MRDDREMREATPSDTTGSLSGCSCCSGCSCLAAPRGAANPALAVLAALASLAVLDALSVDALCKRLTKTLPAQTARRGRAAAEQGHTRSYWIAGSKFSLLLPLLRCCSSWCWRSGSCCSCCSRCSGFSCRACSSRCERASRSMTARFRFLASRLDGSAKNAK